MIRTNIVVFRRVHGFATVDEFYESCSCLHLIPKVRLNIKTIRISILQLRVPMLFMNAQDDPIVPPQLWQPVQHICEQQPGLAFVLTKHGGHLGFLEGTSISPNSVTWLDRFIGELADAAVRVYDN